MENSFARLPKASVLLALFCSSLTTPSFAGQAGLGAAKAVAPAGQAGLGQAANASGQAGLGAAKAVAPAGQAGLGKTVSSSSSVSKSSDGKCELELSLFNPSC
jgi:hypothetical protein